MSTMSLDFATVHSRRVVRWSQVKRTVAEWRRRSRSRRELARLSDMYLQDIGVSRCDADFESSKPFWLA